MNAVNLASSRLITYGMRGFYVLFLAAMLGPSSYGLFIYAQSWTQAFVPLSLLGLNVILAREIGRDRVNALTIASRVLAIQMTSGFISVLACVTIGLAMESTTDGRILIAILTLSLAARVFSWWGNSVFIALENTRYVLHLEVVFRLLDMAIGIAVVMAGGGAIAVAWVFTVTWSAQAVVSMILVRRLLGPVRPRFGARAAAWSFIVKALPVAAGALGMVWLGQGAMILYRHSAGTGVDLGQLGLAMQANQLIILVLNSASMAAMPVLSRAAQREDGKDMLFLGVIIRAIILGGGATALCGMAVGPWLLTLVLGSTYTTAGHYVGITLWILIPYTVGNLAGNILIARDRRLTYAVSSLAGAAIMTMVLPLLVDRFGAAGAIGATIAGAAVWSGACLVVLRGAARFEPWRAVWRPGAAVAVAAVTLLLTREPLGIFVAFGLAMACLTFASIALHVVTVQEWRALWSMVKRRRETQAPQDPIS